MRISVVIAVCLGLLFGVATARAGEARVMLVFGDSLSAGYGISARQAWPALLGEALARRGDGWQVVNASVSGETTAGGLTRLQAALAAHRPALVLIALGANDGLRGLPLAEAERNLARMFEAAKDAGARVHLVGMQLPPNYGPEYTAAFAAMYPRLAQAFATGLTPFLLAPVAARGELFQPDRLHPTAEAQPAIAEQVLRDLEAGALLR